MVFASLGLTLRRKAAKILLSHLRLFMDADAFVKYV